MHRRYFVLLASAAVMLLLAGGTSASPKQKIYPFPVGINVTGPRSIDPDIAIRGYVLVVKNNTTHTFRRLSLTFTPANVIFKSGKRFKKIRLQAYTPSTTARWILYGLQPHATMKIPMTLKFPALQPKMRPTLGIFLDGQELGGGAFGHNFVRLYYKVTK